jgi:hypothetical protein
MPKASAKAFPCPNCARPLSLSPALDGRQFRCRTCGTILSLAVQAPPRGRRRGTMVVTLVSADEPCPGCRAPLHLVPALQNRRIRCRRCKSLLAVSVRPWRLSPVESQRPSMDGETSSDAGDEAVAVEAGRIGNPSCREADLVDGLPIRPAAKPAPIVSPLSTEPPALPDKPAAAPAPSSLATAAATPFNAHAIDEPRRNPRALGIGLAAAALVLLSAGAWWLFSGRPVHPQARYLPATCQRFVSIRWSLLARNGIDPTACEAPGLIPLERCRIFLRNAAIEAAEVERINVGVAADGEGTLLVYRLTRPVRAEAIVESGPFRDPLKRPRLRETAGGVVLYSLGRTALAFPDSRTIVNGETELLRRTLAGHGAFADPLNGLLGTLDFSAPVVIASVGVGEPVQSLLQRSGVKSEAVSGTTDCFQTSPTVPLVCVLHLRNPRSADSVAEALKTALAGVARDPNTAPAVRRLLAGSHVSAAGGKVQVQLTAEGDPAAVQPLALLKPLFY